MGDSRATESAVAQTGTRPIKLERISVDDEAEKTTLHSDVKSSVEKMGGHRLDAAAADLRIGPRRCLQLV